MKKIEFIIGLIAVIALSLTLFNIPGGAFLIIVTFSVLSIFYYLSFALINDIEMKNIFKKEAYENTTVKRIIGAIVVGLSFSLIIMGALFKI